MTTVAELKTRVCAEIDRQADQLLALNEEILRTPETGYRETRTAELVRDRFGAMGLRSRTGLARTGVKTRIRGRSSRRTVAILGELDSLIVSGHPFADPVTSAAHACGHNAQIAAMIGAGLGLLSVADDLDGDVVLFAVPAEECIELDWRCDRLAAGDFEFLLGKAELIRLGEFDDVDMAMLTHAGGPSSDPLIRVGNSANAALVKRVSFGGRAAHAGAAPWDGVNAAKALNLALTAIDAQRETFRDVDGVRVHHLVTECGDAVSAVPARARMEMMVRARDLDALARASDTVDRSLRAGALAFGATVEIMTVSGYLPLATDEPLDDVVYGNAVDLVGDGSVERDAGHLSWSTDLGDLGHLMPVAHPISASGCDAGHHSDTYYVTDGGHAVILPAKVMACTVVDLLCDGARGADRVLEHAGVKLTKEEYLRLRRGFDTTRIDTPDHPVDQ